ncbi:SRPBCC domain-containing protein [Streptomonospora nanhaiensis]|uniref:Activator of Hsp90 ATPase homologue 1/2-like C-terminal domain-containing protein n=1 Tax=Streptomonospora nanhaiensis TaxID=1323731 RepID=A0A853BJ24_9ACTN|nr:SRPBCC domain-containing protein [Streptomonospora nanhaiensis]MBX9386649.1 SRPBCC domain-containing protein [Streptomonospora nanhaiensis]NYI94597.1 hypothetical protein [Streptomonospora nanhaiensis]
MRGVRGGGPRRRWTDGAENRPGDRRCPRSPGSDPPRLLELDWSGDLLRFELHPVGEGTELVFTQTFDQLGRAARDTTGWHVCLDALGAHLDGASHEAAGEWRRLNAHYAKEFGPEAATIGPPEGHEPA